MKKFGFTLAEALIAIAIIAIVAALTIPTLVRNYQKKVTVERLKTTYSLLYQAIKRSEVDNGPLESWNMPSATWLSDENYTKGKVFAEQYLLPYLQTQISDCGLRPNKCIPEKWYNLSQSTDNSNSYGASNNHYYSFVLKNGTIIVLNDFKSDDRFQLTLLLDSKNKPSIRGKNTFFIMVTKSNLTGQYGKHTNKPGVYFVGQGYNRYELTRNAYDQRGCATNNQSGDFCGALIQLDGWQIKDDYPW